MNIYSQDKIGDGVLWLWYPNTTWLNFLSIDCSHFSI